MMLGVMRDHAFRLVVNLPARIHIAIKAWEVAARNFNANAMTVVKIIACHHTPG